MYVFFFLCVQVNINKILINVFFFFTRAKLLALNKLMCIRDMTNETVGDAYSDMLIVETVLCERGWSLSDWYNTYLDLPNRLTKVTVKVKCFAVFVSHQ